MKETKEPKTPEVPEKGTKRKALFIGNSYSDYNSLDRTVSLLAKSVNDTLIYAYHTPKGTGLDDHANSSALMEKIKSENWDYVAIQPSSSIALELNWVEQNTFHYAKAICDTIRGANQNTIPVFFVTWGLKYGVSGTYCDSLPYLCTYLGMDNILRERFQILAERNRAYLSPVGYVWRKIINDYPDINLYTSDNSHPSRIGSYAAACTFYTIFFEKDPSLLQYDEFYIDDDIETIIKKVTKDVVFNHLEDFKKEYSPIQ
jgi:hypothetical protein